MAKASKSLTTGASRTRLNYKLNYKMYKPSEIPLVLTRIKELDREFARQTKQLTALTKRLQRRVSDSVHILRDKADD